MNSFFVPLYQLYLLQLENYELERYWRLLFAKGYVVSNQPLRKTLVWTQKVVSIFFLSFLLYGATAFLIFSFFPTPSALFICFIGLFILFPVFYTISTVLLWPADFFLKQFYIRKATRMLASANNVRIIGIAGSYGKTTMKHILSSVLSATYSVIATPESVNTPIGIAQWLGKALTKETEIVIVEMGEHYRGDIAYLSSITPPDIAVLTGINEAHLERLQTLDTSIATMFEIVNHAKQDGHIILNADDERIVKNYLLHTNGKNVSFYSAFNNPLAQTRVTKKVFDEKTLRWSCAIDSLGVVSIPLLGEYAIGDVVASVLIGMSLGMKKNALQKGIATISPTPHRLEPMHGTQGTLVIDDAYNGNPDGVKEAIHVLSRFKKRRKIFLTPGLVETGNKAEDVHKEIGRELAGVADVVILVKNSVTPFLAQGLRERGFDESKIIWFNTAGEAHKGLSGIIMPDDVILFQNDWGDQYV